MNLQSNTFEQHLTSQWKGMPNKSINPLLKNQTFSGIEVLGNMAWGTHFCQFYDTKRDLLDVLVPYFKTGLQNNEFCLWIACDPIDIKEAAHALKKAVPELDRYIKEQKIEILSHEDWYLKVGKFNPKEVLKGWNTKLSQALEKSFAGMRVSANEGWLGREVWKNFIEYEGELGHFLIGKRMIVLCTYPLQKCTANDVLNVAHVHECAISKRKGQWEIMEVPAVKKSKAQIQKINDELEERVVERTAQLAKANEKLKHEIAEHEKAEDALRKSEEALRLIIDTIPIMAWTMRPDGTVDFLNQRWMDYSGLSLEQYVKDPVAPLHPDDIARVMEKWKPYMAAGEPHEDEMRLQAADGKYRWFLVRNAPLHDRQGNLIKWYGVSIDIEDSKQIEEELHSLSSHLQNIQEIERATIAREIHDELGQQLTALKMEVSSLSKKLPDKALLKEKTKDILSLISDVIKTVRGIAIELRPVILEDLGLFAALDWQAKEFCKRADIACVLQLDAAEPELEKNMTSNIFRIFQESLTNVAKHAKATAVTATLKVKNKNLIMTIQDNGIGFEEEEVKQKKSFGLLGMRERAIAMKGEIKIVSRKGKGTSVQLILPLVD